MHLIIDAYYRNNVVLSDVELMKAWLKELVDAVGMRPIGEPTVVECNDTSDMFNGLTGIVVLVESSITVHAFPHFHFVFIDIFSCLDFDYEVVLTKLRECLRLYDIACLLLQRGIIKEPHPQAAIVREVRYV